MARIEIGIGIVLAGLSTLGFLNSLPAGVTLLVVGCLLISHAIIPWVWSNRKRRKQEVAATITKHIQVEGDVVCVQQDKTAVIRVRNLAIDGSSVTNCTGLLHGAYYIADGRLQKEAKIAPVYLQWSARHGGIGHRELTFHTEAELDVAVITSSPTGNFQLAAFDPRLRNQYWLNERREWIFDIEISAENMPSACCRYRLITDPLGLRSTPDGTGGYLLGPLPNWTFEVIRDS